MRPWLWRIAITLGKLYQTQARQEEAEQFFATARTILEELAINVPDEREREQFLRQARAMLPLAPATEILICPGENLRTALAQSPYLSTMANRPFSGILLVTVEIRRVTIAQTNRGVSTSYERRENMVNKLKLMCVLERMISSQDCAKFIESWQPKESISHGNTRPTALSDRAARNDAE